MKSNDKVYCDKCHLEVAPRDPGGLHYGKVDYHASCYLDFLRKHRAIKPTTTIETEAVV